MESFKSLFCCLFPGIQRNTNRNREKARETIMEKRREKIKQITHLRVSALYPLRRARILNSIDFDYSKILIIWTLSEDVVRAEVITALHEFGRLVRIQDRWSIKEDESETWKGVIAEFKCAKDAERASVSLPILIRHVRATLLKTVIETLVDCELLSLENRKDKEDQESTKVAICRRVPFRHQEVEDLHRNLSTYGSMQTFFINHRQTTIGAICEVTYPYVTHAYLALLMTDALRTFRGVLMASLEKTTESAEILNDAKVSIKYLEQRYFPV